MGVRHGQGVCKWSNGDTYTGQFEKDLPHGRGVFQAKDGGKYEGDFKFFLRHGKGTLQSLSGIYTGDWVDDRREGQGTQKYINGDEYTGGWKDDMVSYLFYLFCFCFVEFILFGCSPLLLIDISSAASRSRNVQVGERHFVLRRRVGGK